MRTRKKNDRFSVLQIIGAIAFVIFLAGNAFATSPAAPNNKGPGSQTRTTYAPSGVTSVGSIEVNAIGASATTTGTAAAVCTGTCTTNHTYGCVAEDQNAVASTGEGEGIESATFTTNSKSAATLSATNYDNVTCAGDPRTYSFLVTNSGATGYYGRCYAWSGQCTFAVTSTSTTAYTGNTVDQTGKVLGGVSSIAGDVRTVRIAATASLIKGIASPITMCTTSGLNGACTEPTAVLSPGFADANYTVACSCASVGTNVPEIYSVTKASNSLVIGIVSAGATPSASCAEIDCNMIHD